MSNRAYLATKTIISCHLRHHYGGSRGQGTIASFTNGVGKIIELTGCTIAVKPLVSKLGLEGRFRFDDSRTIGLVSEDLRLT